MQKLKSLENNSSAELNNIQRMLIKSESELSALHGIAERYDGYVRSVKRVMELAKNNKDILGVIADVISTDKQYEVAVETAFGSRLQNIITTDEKTAKGAIDILIKEKAGRATSRRRLTLVRVILLQLLTSRIMLTVKCHRVQQLMRSVVSL